ncbi:MAG: zinc ribbon domain-containing protein [Blastocatellia bacterium]|nr:zinc ribbon domain-containing protein [Blastocatellia bacterium]
MFCPNCGASALTPEQRFCKTCGTNLAVVSQVLSAPQPPAPVLVPARMSPPAPVAPPVPPSSQIPSMIGVNPIPLTEIPDLPYMQEESKRQHLRKIGWAMALGGPLFVPVVAIIMAVFNGKPEVCAMGIPIFLIGIFLLLFTRFGLKQNNLPQIIFAQSPNQQPVANPQMTPAGVQAQLPPPSVSSYTPGSYLSGTLTEQTTNRLEMPFPPSSRDTR